MSVRTWLLYLTAEECDEQLSRSKLGRIGVIVEGRPEIYPVNHVFDPTTRTIAFPTTAGTKLYAALRWPWVAYEVDGVDPAEEGGWSVLVVGRAEELTDAAEIARLEEQRDVLWRTEDAMKWVRIFPTKTTGRRITAHAG